MESTPGYGPPDGQEQISRVAHRPDCASILETVRVPQCSVRPCAAPKRETGRDTNDKRSNMAHLEGMIAAHKKIETCRHHDCNDRNPPTELARLDKHERKPAKRRISLRCAGNESVRMGHHSKKLSDCSPSKSDENHQPSRND